MIHGAIEWPSLHKGLSTVPWVALSSHRVQSATLQRHSAGNIDYDNLESYDNVPETQIGHDQSNFQTRSKTVSDGMGESRPPASPRRHQWGWGSGREYDIMTRDSSELKAVVTYCVWKKIFKKNSVNLKEITCGLQLTTRPLPPPDELSDSTTKSDGGKDEVGTRSEGEEEVIEKKKATLGRTPNHLSLSTTSTLSTGSTGSMAKLIQASNQPSQYQPAKSVGKQTLIEVCMIPGSELLV